METRGTRPRHGWLCLWLLVLGIPACRAPERPESTPSASRPIESVRALLRRQTDAWNAGDLERFMREYWRSPDLVFFSDGAATRGWQETLDRYRQRYPDHASMGRLSFQNLVIEPVHPDLVAASGSWHLQREEPAEGRFLLIVERRSGRWVITVDATTSKL